jgi:16S rRNA processing protein RimM
VKAAERPSAGERQTVKRQEPKNLQPGSGAQGRAPELRFLVIGRVAGVHGLRGELKVDILTDDPHRFGLLERVFVGLEDQEPTPWRLEGYRLHKGRVLLKLGSCDDRTTAETLRRQLIQVPLEEALPLEEGRYFEHQIVDLEVWTTGGEHLGRVVEVVYTGANEVYVVRNPGPGERDLLIPAIEEVVLEVDLEGGRLIVELMEGLR